MARAFDEREQERIRGKLLESGRRLFITMGLRKTTVDRLAADAGIGKGTFYRFFSGKEALCMELFRLEELRKEALLESGASARPETFFPEALKLIEENELVRALYRHDDWPLLIRMMDDDYQEQNRLGDDAFSRELLGRWGALEGASEEYAGELVSTLTAVLRTLFLASLHAQEVGDGYGRAMELLCAGAAARFGELHEP